MASKVRKGLELEPFRTQSEPKSDLPDVRFEMWLIRSHKLAAHFDPPSSASRSCVVCESKGGPSTPWFLCRTFESISSFISAKLMTASSKSSTNPAIRWLFPFIIQERTSFYSLSPPAKNTPWLYRGTSLITCWDFENAYLFLKNIRNLTKTGCLFLQRLRNISKNGCLYLIFFRPLPLCDVVSDPKTNLKKIKKYSKNGCLFLKK